MLVHNSKLLFSVGSCETPLYAHLRKASGSADPYGWRPRPFCRRESLSFEFPFFVSLATIHPSNPVLTSAANNLSQLLARKPRAAEPIAFGAVVISISLANT